MPRVHTPRRPDDFRIGDTLYTGGKPARIARMSQTTVTARLGDLHFELNRRDLRRKGHAAHGERVFHLTPEAS